MVKGMQPDHGGIVSETGMADVLQLASQQRLGYDRFKPRQSGEGIAEYPHQIGAAIKVSLAVCLVGGAETRVCHNPAAGGDAGAQMQSTKGLFGGRR